jgi:hypothetical protein
MIKSIASVLAVTTLLSSTAVTAEEGQKSVVRMVIMGTDAGKGVFTTNAFSISAGAGVAVIGDAGANAQTGAIATAVIAGDRSEGVDGGIVVLDALSSPYETCVPVGGNCP